MKLHYRAEGWLNDPHGIIYYGGQYHLFHQSVPGASSWEPGIHWGHAVGPDLVSLTYQGSAILPGNGDDGIWTGCIVLDDHGPKAYYTSVQEPDLGLSRIRVARPTDDSLHQWVKGEVVATAPETANRDFRDPFVLREDQGWRMFVGSDSPQGAALAHTYRSVDGQDWSYDGIALSRDSTQRDPIWMGSLWECPQFFFVDGSWVMLTSVWHDQQILWASYAIGSLSVGRFMARSWGRLSFGTIYAPTIFRDKDDQISLMAWIRETQGDGWVGCLTVPYRLRVVQDRLVAVPHPDVAGLSQRWSPEGDLRLGDITLSATAEGVKVTTSSQEAILPNASGEAVEIFLDDAAIEVVGAEGLLALPV